jgi:DNA-binding MarR family transcriptional regulator
MTAAAEADGRELARAIRRSSAQYALFSQALATQLGIGVTDLDCLLLLDDLGPATPGQLAEALNLTTGAITGVVDRLVSAGFVLRENDPADRRRVIVSPVLERVSVLGDAQAPLLAATVGALESISPTDQQRLLDFLNRVADLLTAETARIRGEHLPRTTGSDFTAPLGQLEAAVLEFATGAAEVRIGTLDLAATALYSATFEGAQPTVRVQGGSVTFRYRRLGPFEWGGAKHAGVVLLNPNIPWSIAVRGGASAVAIDASGLLLRELSINGGVNKLDLCLPPPSTTVNVCLDGGVSRVRIQRPAAVPVQLRVHGGANRLEFDAQHFGAVGGDAVLASPGWELATDRYAIEVRGGASRLSVQELQEGLSRAHDI